MKEEVWEEGEWEFVQILENPVLFREFINEGDENWNGLEEHERAWTACTSHFVSLCCGRGVHKTTSMIEMLYYWMINGMFIQGDQGLFVLVPNKAQKDPTFFRIRAACLSHWLIKQFVNTNSINVTEGKIDFVNGFQFLMRIAGAAGSESNVIGLHTYRIWVDEAQAIPWRTWLSLQNCLKDEIVGYQMLVSGVPNGERRENVLYETDQLADKYTTFNTPQTVMSWWTPEMEFEKRKQYHAIQEDSEDYKHYVLGQHGVPTFSVFDRIRFLKEDYDVQRLILTQHMFDSTKRPDIDGTIRYHINEVVMCPPVPIELGQMPKIGLGYDVGYSPDPAVFFVMYEDVRTGKWKNLARYVLQRVEYAIQREVLAYLDKIYSFNFLGIDMGGPGKVQYQDLAGELSEYKSHNFMERLYPVEFGGFMLVAAQDSDGEIIEKKDNVKRVAVETVSRWVHEHRFSFSIEDDNLMSELERTKFTRTNSGEPIYRTDDDHQFAAMMCAIMAYEHKYGSPIIFEKITPTPRLLSAKWLDTFSGKLVGA